MRYLDQLDLKGKRVFVRADLNVPLDKNGCVADDTRIKATLPTIQFILEAGGSVILASHMGRPKGVSKPEFSLHQIVERLRALLKRPVAMVSDCVGPSVTEAVNALTPGSVLLLENLRFYIGEEKNDPEFAKQLAALADVYVNEAFATSHRASASISTLPRLMKECAGGFMLKTEIEYFQKAFDNPAHPLVAIFGGSKVSTKMAAICNVAKRAQKIIVGGAMANTFFVAQGLGVGKSLYEPELVETAKNIQKEFQHSGCVLHLPTDVVIAPQLKSGVPTSVVDIAHIPSDQMALDIGPRSVAAFGEALNDAKTIIWNGPMGAFETTEFASGTFGIIDHLCASKALRVVGGGDTDLALHQRHAFEKMSYVSTAGGAFLELLEGKRLPGIDALS